MNDDDEMEQVNHLVPKTTKERANQAADWGELSEVVRDVYEVFANTGGDSEVARLEAERRRVEAQIQSHEAQVDSLQDELEELRNRKTQLSDRIAEAESRTAEYEEKRDTLLSMLDDGDCLWPSHGTVQEAASVNGKTPDEVIDELRELRPHLPDDRFTEGTGDTVKFSATEDDD
jgi:DNA repair exonuclease SbcCD ATPase subunit